MGAACVTHPKDADEVTKGNMDVLNARSSAQDKLSPTSPISLLFEVMSEEIGYDASALQSYCAQLQSLWIYRVIDALNIDDETWNALQIPSVLEHVIRDYLSELGNTDKFKNYASKSHTDIYVTFVSKDIRSLFKELLKSVDNLESAAQHIVYLERILSEEYLLNTDKLKKYMTAQEWQQLNVATNLKTIICAKINLNFCDETRCELKSDDEDSDCEPVPLAEGERDDVDDQIPLITPQGGSSGGVLQAGFHNMQSILSSKISAIRTSVGGDAEQETSTADYIFNDIVFDESICQNKELTVRSNMMEVAQYFSGCLLVDDVDEMYSHFQYFADYGYHTLYHLSFISNALFDQLLLITKTPTCARLELLELVESVRNKYDIVEGSSNEDISHCNILPFASNLYWEKTTDDAFGMLQEDVSLDLSSECDVLMNDFYSNVWDWQFIPSAILGELVAYHKYEIVRIRMHHMMKLCQYQYGQQHIPLLPPIWNSKYNSSLSIQQLFAMDCDEESSDSDFHFDGVQWNQITQRQINIVCQYLDANLVRKIQFLPIQHRKEAEKWNQLMQNNKIAPHLRFKINFYAIRGLPNSDDDWINSYIECNFQHNSFSLPQWQQSMDVAVITTSAMQMFDDIQHKVMAIQQMLHYIHVFKRMQIKNCNTRDMKEMNQTISETIAEIDQMGLNQEFYQIIQFCGTQALKQLKATHKTLFAAHCTLDDLDEAKWNELAQTKQILKDMKQAVYSIPIHDIVALSQTVSHSVQWLQNQLEKYKTNQ